MCRHRISRPLTLLTLWRRSGGAEVVLSGRAGGEVGRLVDGDATTGEGLLAGEADLAGAVDVDDASAAIANVKAAWEALTSAGLGFESKDLPMVLGDGYGVTFSIDMPQMMKAFGAAPFIDMAAEQGEDVMPLIEKMMHTMLGGDSIDARYITSGHVMTVAIGNDKGLVGTARRLAREGNDNPALAKALDSAYAGPTWAVSMDMSEAASQMYPAILTAAGPARVMMPPKLPDTGSVVLDMAGSSNSDGEQIRVQTDLAQWIDWFKAIDQAANAPHGDV